MRHDHVPLTAGQTIPVGTVTVSNDLNNLYITYALDSVTQPGATFGTLHAWVGNDMTNLPVSQGSGAPIPGQFPYKPDATGLTTYTITIPFLDLFIQDANGACGTPLYVVTHAEVNGVDANGDGAPDGNETAFGGPTPGSGPRWWFYGLYSVCCDFGPPPVEACSTAYGKGSHVFTTDKKSNPEKLPSLNLTRNRWGWAVKSRRSGHLRESDVDGCGPQQHRQRHQCRDGNGLVGRHYGHRHVLPVGRIFVQGGARLHRRRRADDHRPGQYGNIAYMDGSETSYTFTAPLSDVDGVAVHGSWRTRSCANRSLMPAARGAGRTARPFSLMLCLGLVGAPAAATELGSPTAAIVVEEFSDYRCPYCRVYASRSFPAFAEEYVTSGRVRYGRARPAAASQFNRLDAHRRSRALRWRAGTVLGHAARAFRPSRIRFRRRALEARRSGGCRARRVRGLPQGRHLCARRARRRCAREAVGCDRHTDVRRGSPRMRPAASPIVVWSPAAMAGEVEARGRGDDRRRAMIRGS
jgi:hypothetical protein